MTAAFVIARVFLAGVLGVAAVAKLFDRGGAREGLRAFGLSARLVDTAWWLLPLIELAIAIGLFPGATARWAAIGAFVLLALFSAAMAAALARGDRVDCHCFGQLSDTPIGWPSLARNAALLALAGFVAFAPGAPGPGIGTWLGARSDAGLVAFWLGATLVALTAAAGWFGRELLRQQGRLMLRLEELEKAAPETVGLPLGAPAPRFMLEAWPDGRLALDELLAAGLPIALVFSDPQCGPCAAAVPLIADAQRKSAGRLTIAVVSNGISSQSESAWREHQLDRVGIADGYDVALSYGIVGSPAAVIVSREGRIAARPAFGLDRITELLRVQVAGANGGDSIEVGEWPAADRRQVGYVQAP